MIILHVQYSTSIVTFYIDDLPKLLPDYSFKTYQKLCMKFTKHFSP